MKTKIDSIGGGGGGGSLFMSGKKKTVEIRCIVLDMDLTDKYLGSNDLYTSPNIVRVIKSRRMRWAGHVTRMGEERGCIGSWWGNRREGDHWGDLGIDGCIILGWISRGWDVGIWTGLGWPRIETGGGRL